jgi:integrase
MAKEVLTDKRLKALKPAPAGARYEIMDAIVPGLGIRITDKADKKGKAKRRTFMLLARYPGSKNPTRRALAEYGALTLEEARDKARDWLKLLQRGEDPAHVEERERQAVLTRQANTVAAVAEDFIKDKLPSERKGAEVERDIRRDLLPKWGKRPITDITKDDVIAVIKAKKRTAPAQARNLLGIAKRLFSWAIDQSCYGLDVSPAEYVRPVKIIGEKKPVDRILSDEEMFALWRATERTPYPHGPTYQLLILTALRLNEVADASWPELDLTKREWIIPAKRMKGRNSKARAHAVPLIDDMMTVLERLPRFTGKDAGPYLFSTSMGQKPAWMSDKVKKRIDARMLRTLKALARMRGDDPAKVELPHWTNHDIRRSVRSSLSRLRVTEEAREAVLAHARPGIKATYDLHDYFDEKREALELWAGRLRSIVSPPPANVVPMKRGRA